MSDPKIVTDKSPKFLLGVQRDVMNSQRYVGGVDLSVWGQPFEVGTLKYLGGSKDGQTIPTSDYTVSAPDTDYSVVVTLNTALTDGRVNWVSAPSGYGVVKISNTQWKLCKTITIQIAGGGYVDWEHPSQAGFAKQTPEGWTATGASVANPSNAWDGDPGTAGVQTPALGVTGYSTGSITWGAGTPAQTQLQASWYGIYENYAQANWATWKVLVNGVSISQGNIDIPASGIDLDLGVVDPSRVDLRLVTHRSVSPSFSCSVAVSEVSLRRVTLDVGGTLGPVKADGSRIVTLAADVSGLIWLDAPSGWEAVKDSGSQYTLKYTGPMTNPTLVEADLDAAIKANEQLEVRGGLTIYNNLTINGKLYITQELGF